MWTKEIYKKALEEYREIEKDLQESKTLSWKELYEKYDGFNDCRGFDVNYKSLTVTIEEGVNGIRLISNVIEVYGDESTKCEMISLEELINKAK